MRIYQVDAFTKSVFKGNPAGVCILNGKMPGDWMQNIAMEMNLSETAFLLKESEGYSLRWFTPEQEVDLCGHATLASAHILWEKNYLDLGAEAVFYTRSGILHAKKKDDYIELDFPKEEASVAPVPEGLQECLGVELGYVGRNRMDYLVEVASEDVLRNMKPDFEKLKKVSERGIIVTCRSAEKEYDFVSRFFAPGIGINEDPATGSAHCCLGPYWQTKLHKAEFSAYQASKRGAELKVRVEGDRVRIGGYAVTVFEADMEV